MFTPPARKSMSDAELQKALGEAQADEAGILAAMELLEHQSTLREQDDRVFAEWSRRLEELGTPEALHAIENGRRLIAGLEPVDFEQRDFQPTLEPAAIELEPDSGTAQNESQPAVETLDLEPQKPTLEIHNAYDDALSASLSALYAPAQVSAAAPAEVSVATPAESTPEVSPQPIDFTNQEVKHEEEALHVLEQEATVVEEHFLQPDEADPQSELPEFDDIISQHIVTQSANTTPGAELEPQIESDANTGRAWRFDFASLSPWLSINSVGFAALMAYGVHLVATDALSGLLGLFLGILFANIPIAAGIIAAKRSGHTAIFVSRAAFGVFGNQIPGWIYVCARLIAAACALAIVIVQINQGLIAEAAAPMSSPIAAIAIASVSAAAIALGLSSAVRKATNLVGSALSLVLSVALVACLAPLFSFSNIDFSKAASSNLIEIAALVFALIASLWVPSAADFAASYGKSTRAISALATNSLGTFVAPLVLTGFFYLAFAGAGTLTNQIDAGLLSSMFSISPLAFWLLISGIVVSSILWATDIVASTRNMISSLVSKATKSYVSVVVSIALFAITVSLLLAVPSVNTSSSLVAVFSLAAIPALAWAGIFTSDVLLRRVAYHEVSLSRSYGFYKPANLTNLIGWLLSTTVGFAFIDLSATGLQSLTIAGFAKSFAPELFGAVSSSGAILAIVFAIAAVFPIAFGIHRIKQQEREALALEARRDDLKDIFKFGE